MAGNKRGEGDSTLPRISPICRYTVINFAYRRLARAPSAPRVSSRAAQNVLISIAHCWRRGPPRFSFRSIRSDPNQPLLNGRKLPIQGSFFRFLSVGREINSRDSFLFFFWESFFLRIVFFEKRTIRIEDRVQEGNDRNKRTLEGTEFSRGRTIARRRVTLEAKRERSVYPSNWSNFRPTIAILSQSDSMGNRRCSPLMESRF